MRKPLSREEIRRRALRAATAVAVGGGLGGCDVGADVPVQGAAAAVAAEGAALDAVDGSGMDAGATEADVGPGRLAAGGADVAADAAADSASADVAAADAAGAADADEDASADAETDVADAADTSDGRCRTTDDWERYAACCNANGWDFNKGCMAWGPPPPPSANEAEIAAFVAALRAYDIGRTA